MRIGKTGPATFVQLLAGTIISILSGIVSILGACTSTGGSECISNAFISLLLIIFSIFGYGALFAFGYFVQVRHTAQLAYSLASVEVVIALISLFNLRHAGNIFNLLCNVALCIVALWIAYTAFRQARSKGRRVVRAKVIHGSTR